jgi:hypothetical protein
MTHNDSPQSACLATSGSSSKKASLQIVHPHSENKIGGTIAAAEHPPSPFVVGAGNANTRGDIR